MPASIEVVRGEHTRAWRNGKTDGGSLLSELTHAMSLPRAERVPRAVCLTRFRILQNSETLIGSVFAARVKGSILPSMQSRSMEKATISASMITFFVITRLPFLTWVVFKSANAERPSVSRIILTKALVSVHLNGVSDAY
jgi:hypothetical protein